ncbi:MAG: hypothetical protein JWR59_601, partial [Brevundimonas sp.]|nr:hypothetical protein [Brevundimonas sp.]
GIGEMNFQGLEFGACASGHIFADRPGAVIRAVGNYAAFASAPFHVNATVGAFVLLDGVTLAQSNGPVWVSAFAVASIGGIVGLGGNTVTGSSKGSRYNAFLNGIITSGGATLPGSTAGSTATGGQYS